MFLYTNKHIINIINTNNINIKLIYQYIYILLYLN